MRILPPRFVLLTALLLAMPTAARDLFTAVITVDGSEVRTVSTNSILEVPEFFEDSTLSETFASYSPLSSVDAIIDLRGLRARLSSAAASAQLDFEIPGVLSVSFSGTSREEAEEQFEDWLKGDFESPTAPRGPIELMMKALVKHSPVDPVAGNPNSLQSRMFDADWQLGIEGPFLPGPTTATDGYTGVFSTGPEAAFGKSGPFQVQRLELPFSHRANFADWISMLIDLPVAATWTEGEISGLASLGAGVQLRPFSWWSLTPMMRVGAVGSQNVGAVAAIYGGSLTNRFTVPLGPFELGIATQAGASHTIDDIEVGGYQLEYDLGNQLLRNGAQFSGPLGFEIIGGKAGFEISGSHTQFFGDDLYLESMGEVGGALLVIGELAGAPFQQVHIGGAYLFGRDIQGGKVELRFRF